MAHLEKYVLTVTIVLEAVDVTQAVDQASQVVRFNALDDTQKLGQLTVQKLEEKKS